MEGDGGKGKDPPFQGVVETECRVVHHVKGSIRDSAPTPYSFGWELTRDCNMLFGKTCG